MNLLKIVIMFFVQLCVLGECIFASNDNLDISSTPMKSFPKASSVEFSSLPPLSSINIVPKKHIEKSPNLVSKSMVNSPKSWKSAYPKPSPLKLLDTHTFRAVIKRPTGSFLKKRVCKVSFVPITDFDDNTEGDSDEEDFF